MRGKIVLLGVTTVLGVCVLLGSGINRAETPSSSTMEEKVDLLLKKQDEVLKKLDEIAQELRKIKIRVSRLRNVE